MTEVRVYENDELRILAEFPEGTSDSSSDSIPIFVIGDSSRNIPYDQIAAIVQSRTDSKRVEILLDLLMVNGRVNRFIRAVIDFTASEPKWKLASKFAAGTQHLTTPSLTEQSASLIKKHGWEFKTTVLTFSEMRKARDGTLPLL